MLRTVKLLALVAMFFVALASSAQVTTSALSGVVTDENHEALIGATITALHTPSGTQYNAVTNMDGRYSIKG
ncbi:MAG: carboxypeptidase regulatory-like domain-containing protein, partial [Muribaculaceae bacterium]|nr:carboxypeptidase regulatory-like domain-containing protein [Muribaculaceae bacterium]